MRTLDGYTQVKQALSASNFAVGTVTATKVDATGFNRARFVFSFGPGGLTGSISTGIMIYNASVAASSSGTWNSMPTAKLAAITSGALSGGDYVAILDTKIADGYPWLQISGLSMLSTALIASCTVTLYDGTRKNPATQYATQVVVV